MNDETPRTTDMNESRRRGRIPSSEWPQIAERHQKGETLSAIARSYGCTPGAISYILRKVETGAVDEGETPRGEAPQAEAPQAETAPAAAPSEPVRPTLTAARPVEPTRTQPEFRERPGRPAEAPARPILTRAPTPAPRPAPAASDAAPDDVGDRLDGASRQVIDAYRSWQGHQDSDRVLALQQALHEMRKVLARVEIEMAASRSTESALPPFPVRPRSR